MHDNAYFKTNLKNTGEPSIQKPNPENLNNAKKIFRLYKNTNTPLMVHENFRWQTPLMELKKIEKKYKLKNPQYAKISFRHANPVGYTNQTYLYLSLIHI